METKKKIFFLLFYAIILVTVIISVFAYANSAIAKVDDDILLLSQYLLIFLTVITAAIPFLLYNLFLIGGQLFWYLSSKYGQWIQILDMFAPRMCIIAIVASCFVLEWKICLIMAVSSFTAAFILMLAPSAITQGQSSFIIRQFVPALNVVSALSAFALLGSFLF